MPVAMNQHRTAFVALALLPWIAAGADAGDWNNVGGNPACNGLTQELGPGAQTLLWSGGKSSIIAWQPVTEGPRVFLVRQTSFVPAGVPSDAPIVSYDIETGQELWTAHLPYTPGEWTTWVGGVKDGRVYASRAGNGASSAAPLYCLDAATGAVLWFSTELIDAGAYDGMTFAPTGDPIVASFRDIWRFDATSGAQLWKAPRLCSVSGNCGGAVFEGSVYVADAAGGGHVLKRFDAATGAFLYASPVMPGFLMQNAPNVGPDGTVYLNRVQNNPTVDFFYAFDDTGAAFVERWKAPANYNTAVQYAIGPAGDVYMMAPGHVLQRLDPATGAVLSSFPFVDSAAVRMATDVDGRVYVSNGEFAAGEFYCFEADLTLRWSTPVTNVNIGAPALGRDGTLIVAGVGSDLRAYRSPLAQDVHEVSASAGGTQTLKLHAPAHAGETYWLVGSASGKAPGLPVGAVTLPLNYDAYMLWTITHPNSPILSGSLGQLGAGGDATATLNVPAGAPLAGLPLALNHAFLVVDLAAATASFASNAGVVRLIP
jgi:outer membrane protein assembly factor BamB